MSRYSSGVSGLERAKDQNPFVGFKNNYVNKLQNMFKGRPAGFDTDTSNEIESDQVYVKENKALNERFNKQNKGKSFLDKAIAGGLDYFDKTKDKEKTDADKLIDFYKNQVGQAQFGGAGSGAFSEVAQGFRYGQLPAQSQQMFIPGEKPDESIFSIGGAIKGGIGGFKAGGIPGMIGGAVVGGLA